MIIAQFGQVDPVDALATCAAAPAACTNFSTVLVNLVGAGIQADRRVLDLVSRAMARGPEGGANPFYASPMAIDVMRFHADADPDGAADLIIQAVDSVLADAVAARAADGPDGFFKHAIDGIEARLMLRAEAPPADLRLRGVRVLQRLVASGLPNTVKQAMFVLSELREPTAVPAVAVSPATVSPAAVAVTAASELSRNAKIAIAAGVGTAVLLGIVLVAAIRTEPTPAPAFAHRQRRRRS